MALPEYAPRGRAATVSLRAHWDHLSKALTQAGKLLARLTTMAPDALQTDLYILEEFLFDGLMNHLDAELRALFPVADSYEQSDLPLTAMLREENARLHEMALTLYRQMRLPEQDLPAFQRAGQELLQHMQGHLQEEEAILFPYLDAHMSEREVEELLARPMRDHTYGIGPTDHHVSSHHMSRFHRPSK